MREALLDSQMNARVLRLLVDGARADLIIPGCSGCGEEDVAEALARGEFFLARASNPQAFLFGTAAVRLPVLHISSVRQVAVILPHNTVLKESQNTRHQLIEQSKELQLPTLPLKQELVSMLL